MSDLSTAQATDPNASWLGFSSLADIANFASSTLIGYTAAKNPAPVVSNTDPVQGAQVASVNAATVQPNLGSTLSGLFSNNLVVGGLVIAAIIYVTHKVTE